MTPNPKVILSSEELSNCLTIFSDAGIHYSPVVSTSGEILGMMSELVLVKASLRHFLDQDRHERVYDHRDLLEPASIVNLHDTFEDVVKVLIKAPTHRVLVTDSINRLVGIIAPRDLLQLLNGEGKQHRNLKKELEQARSQAQQMAQALSSMEEMLARYQMTISNAPQMIHGVDKSGKIVLANRKLHQNLGYNDGELIGLPVTNLYPKSIHHEVVGGLQKMIDEGKPFTTYSTMSKKSGEKIRVDLASSALADKYGNFLHTITICREIDSEALLRVLHGVVDPHN